MNRCHDGSTYVVPNGPVRPAMLHKASPRRTPAAPSDLEQDLPSWAVLCLTCDRCLAVVDCAREEVYADL
jgi:hypothetical protein